MASSSEPASPPPDPHEVARRFELATQAAGIGSWSADLDGGHPRWNGPLYAIHGLPPESTPRVGDAWIEHFVHPEDRAALRAAVQHWRTRDPGVLQHAMRIVRPDGDVRHVVTHTYIEAAARPARMFGLVIDVSAQRGAELALREANERAALAARSVGLGTWELDAASNMPCWDAQMWRLRGLTPRSTPPSMEERRASIHPDDVDRVESTIAQSLIDGAPTHYEFRTVHPDGSVHWIASRSVAVTDGHGRLLRRIGVNWDASAAHAAAAAREERELARRESLAKSRFMARMSHELRTPLNGVLGFAELLLTEEERQAANDPGAALRRHRIEQVRAAGRQLLALIDDLLDFSGAAAGEARPAPAATADGGAAEGAAPACRPRGSLLYIEDNQVNAMIVAELVARRPELELRIAPDGTSGVAQALQQRPDLVLLDMQLPDLDGHEVLRRLREQPETAATPVIAVSANAMPADIARVLAAGAADYWTKPLDFGVFNKALDTLFGPA